MLNTTSYYEVQLSQNWSNKFDFGATKRKDIYIYIYIPPDQARCPRSAPHSPPWITGEHGLGIHLVPIYEDADNTISSWEQSFAVLQVFSHHIASFSCASQHKFLQSPPASKLRITVFRGEPSISGRAVPFRRPPGSWPRQGPSQAMQRQR